MMTKELFERLLEQPEGTELDFKATCYDFHSPSEEYKYLKDIISLANTKRTEPAYIIMGIQQNGDVLTHLGITSIPDDASIQQKIGNRIYPKPKFDFYLFSYNGKKYGVIEIPVYGYTKPLSPIIKLKGLDPGQIYFRRGSSNAEADHDEGRHIENWLAEVREKQKPLPNPNIYEAVPNYIDRTIENIGRGTITRLAFGSETLSAAIANHRLIALLGWGLNGKTTELKQLAYQLSRESGAYVYLLSIKNSLGSAIKTSIHDIDRLPSKQVFVLLDGLDEVSSVDFDEARRLIVQFAEEFPSFRVVVSCRTNFYTTNDSNSNLSTLSDFVPYQLNLLSSEKIDHYLEKTLGPGKGGFIREVLKVNLRDLLGIPYYLVKLAHQYQNFSRIPSTKAGLFQEEIKEQIYQDAARHHFDERELMEEKLYKLLRKVAFVMEAMAVSQISSEELKAILPKAEEYRIINHASSLFEGSAERLRNWKFNLNSTQEYLAAEILAKGTFNEMRSIITIAPERTKIKESWVNTLSFLLSMLDSSSRVKAKLLKMLAKHNVPLLVKLEPQSADEQLRVAVFKKIINKHQKGKHLINEHIYLPQDLARFSEGKQAFEHLLEQLSDLKNVPASANALKIVNHYDLKQYPLYQKKFKSVYETVLASGNTALHHIAIGGYASLFTLTETEFETMFNRFKNEQDTWIKYQLFFAIHITDSQDKYVGFLIEQARLSIKLNSPGSASEQKGTRLANEQIELSTALKSLRAEKAITEFITEMNLDLEHFIYDHYFDEVVVDILSTSLVRFKSRPFVKAIVNLFLKHHEFIGSNPKLLPIFRNQFVGPMLLDAALSTLYHKPGFSDLQTAYSIATFAGHTFVDFLLKEYKSRRLNKVEIQMISNYMEALQNPSALYFNQKIDLNKKGKKKSAPAITQAQIERRELRAIFEQSFLAKEVQKIFTAFGKEELDASDLRKNSVKYHSRNFSDVARDAINLRAAVTPVKLQDVLKLIKTPSHHDSLPSKVYEFLRRHRNATLTKAQSDKIISWCNKKAEEIDFSKSITVRPDGYTSFDKKAIWFSYFLRTLKLQHYPTSLYLDMLFFRKHDDHLEKIITFVQEIVGFERTRDRIIENLQRPDLPIPIYLDYLEWIEHYSVTAALPLLPAFFSRAEESGNFDVLKVYLNLGGNIDELRPVLYTTKGHFLYTLIDKFVTQGKPFIKDYLREKFTIARDEATKLAISSYLIRLQDSKALKYYIAHVRKIKKSPDGHYAENPLYAITKVKFVPDILELYVYSLRPSFSKDDFFDMGSICLASLSNIAMHEGNFLAFMKKFKKWVRKNTRKRSADQALFQNLKFFQENTTKSYYTAKVPALSRSAASKVYKQLTVK